jgi:hypothetical protein
LPLSLSHPQARLPLLYLFGRRRLRRMSGIIRIIMTRIAMRTRMVFIMPAVIIT